MDYDDYNRDELLRRILGLERALRLEREEIRKLSEDLQNERNCSYSLSKTVLRQNRKIDRLEAELERLDEIAAPVIARKLTA